ILIYIPGLVVLYFWWTSFIGPIGIVELLTVGMIPFIAGDVVKIMTAAAVAKGITPKTSYGRETDIDKMKNWHLP
ncbi:MAG: biotin transporter BioY, partial [Promethearchaeota archaeon]